MKKILSIFAAMLCAVAVNAAVIQITPTSPHSSDNLRQALNDAATGDIIEMAAGTYEESAENYIAFTGKEVIVRAAEGANVIIVPKVPIRLKTGARAEFIGVKFDCGHLSDINSYSHMIVPADNSDGKRVILNNCEFYNWQQVSALIQTPSDRKLDSLVIKNCDFHDCYQTCLHYTNANLVGVEIINSTFANITIPAEGEYWAAPIHVQATSGTVLVDHCTFYNVVPRSLSYGVVTTASGSAVVSNCIFMLPATVDMCATNLPEGGAVKNCLTYNYDNWQPYGHYQTATVTDCAKADPLFVNAAEGNFTLGEGSPALTLGAGSTPVGDPRWVPAAPALPWVGLITEANGWNPAYTLNPDEGGLTASATIHFDQPQNNGYGFKMLVGDKALFLPGNDGWYSFHRGWLSASHINQIAGDNDAFWLVVDETGDYKFTWTYADSTLTIAYPASPWAHEDGWYLVGVINGVNKWNSADVTAAEKFEWFKKTEGDKDEWKLTITLAEGDEIKAGYIYHDAIGDESWRPAGTNNNYVVDAAHAGEVTIYLRDSYDGGDDWHYHCLYIDANSSTAINNTEAEVKAVKMMENGQMIIIKNGVKYNVLGSAL